MRHSECRPLLIAVVLLCGTGTELSSQSLPVEGSVFCPHEGREDQLRGGRYLLVMPREKPRFAEVSNASGYYLVNLRYGDVIDKWLTMLYSGQSGSPKAKRRGVGLNAQFRLVRQADR